MCNYRNPIAAEGHPFIAVFTVVAVISTLLACMISMWLLNILSAIFIVLTLFTLFFFRNPERAALSDEDTVVAPADGRVILLEPVSNSPLGGSALKISIFMSVFNVHVNRVPVAGKVIDIAYSSGKFFDVRDERSSFENEQNVVLFETANGVRIAVVQVAGLIARRIVCYPALGDMLPRGERYGMIRFGSRLDVYLPEGVEPLLKVGDRTLSGVTPLGRLREHV